MKDEFLKLTCYFGERHRHGRRFVADALLDVYGRHEITASVMLRGIEGFGLKHHLRSDSSLTLSEDLPAVTIAIDVRSRIEDALREVKELPGVGLITLERAHLVTVGLSEAILPPDVNEATRLTVFLGRGERASGAPAYIAVCDLLQRNGVAGATALLGVDGTVHGRRQRAGFFGRNSEVPAMVMAIGSNDTVNRVLPELQTLVRDPIASVERVRICKRDGTPFEEPHALPGKDEHGMDLWQKITVFTSEATRHEGQPIHRAITRQLRSTGASGATTLRGIWGYHGDHRPHGDRPLRVVRHVPAVTVVVDSPQRIAEAFSVIDRLTSERGLVTAEIVPAMHARSGADERGGLDLGPALRDWPPRGGRHPGASDA